MNPSAKWVASSSTLAAMTGQPPMAPMAGPSFPYLDNTWTGDLYSMGSRRKPSTTVDAKKRLICGAEMGIKMVIFFDVYQKYPRMT